jgi:hypothetical protein
MIFDSIPVEGSESVTLRRNPMGLFGAIRSVFDTGDDEPLKAQEADFKREPSFSSNSNGGYDEIPGTHGPFGIVSTNPIPVNGIIGEMVYLNRLMFPVVIN